MRRPHLPFPLLFSGLCVLGVLVGCAPDTGARSQSPTDQDAQSVASASGDDAAVSDQGPDPQDLASLDRALKSGGLTGHIHGAVGDTQTFVFTVRKKGDFFDYRDLSLVPRNAEVAQALAGIRRHDKVRLFGALATFDAPQPHIYLESLEVVEPWTPTVEVPAHRYQVALPDDLPTDGSLVGKVHAVGEDGKILVIEWRDRVIPVFVEDTEQTESLWRNDKVALAFELAVLPETPTHLQLRGDEAAPITVLDRIEQDHGAPITLEGKLVLFPKSPQLMFDIFAVQIEDEDGVRWNYTLVNFENMEAFTAIREKLGTLWGDAAGIEGRNKLIHPTVRIRVEGVKNVVSARQANPQVLLDGPDDITVVSAD